ncbi:MAG: hypothetical protein J5871_04120 [Bacteroidales bacterium]|nr:hypothetical protein [Bacteroidales bacterium]
MKQLLSTNIGLSQNGYDQKWNQPTISHGNINPYFGMIEPFERNATSAIKEFPSIPGMKYRSCMVICPVDSCYANRAVIALRCPDNSVLLNKISKRLSDFTNKVTNSSAVKLCEQYTTSADIRAYYISSIRNFYSKHSKHREGARLPNEQHGILITDCWQTGDYYTFYEATWFDMDSNGNQTTESYYTVDAKSGKELRLENIVPKDDWGHLEQILPKYLVSDTGKHYEATNLEPWNFTPQELLERRTGCAMIREGLVIFYHPMVIDGALAGGYRAVVPLSELNISL